MKEVGWRESCRAQENDPDHKHERKSRCTGKRGKHETRALYISWFCFDSIPRVREMALYCDVDLHTQGRFLTFLEMLA